MLKRNITVHIFGSPLSRIVELVDLCGNIMILIVRESVFVLLVYFKIINLLSDK